MPFDLLILKIVFVVTAITATVLPAASQTPPAQRSSFEVATVKPANAETSFLNAQPDSGHFLATGFTLKWFVCYAYRLRNDQVLGGLAWVNTDRQNSRFSCFTFASTASNHP